MNKPVYEICFKSGEYTDKNGKTKTTWQKVGAVFESNDVDGGLYALIEPTFNPAGVDRKGKNNVMLSFFKPRDKDAAQPETAAASQTAFADNDTVPF